MNVIFFEDVYQVYVADGNLHLVCGNSTGETDSTGKDKLEINMKIVVPLVKAQNFLPRVLEAVNHLATAAESQEEACVHVSEKSAQDITFGSPIEFQFR